MDYNQCSSRQLIGMLKTITEKYQDIEFDLPVVLIGHSKVFTRFNERNITSFLDFVQSNPTHYAFGTFRDFDLQDYTTALKGSDGM